MEITVKRYINCYKVPKSAKGLLRLANFQEEVDCFILLHLGYLSKPKILRDLFLHLSVEEMIFWIWNDFSYDQITTERAPTANDKPNSVPKISAADNQR